MQQPQSRPLLGDSVSSTTSPTTRRNNNPVAVLTPQQLQQLQQLQSQNSGPQSVTFTLQQPSGNNQEQPNGPAAGNHILYVNQLNQLNQGPLNPSGTGMGLPQATPTFGVGLNMGLPLSLLNTSLASLTSNAITTSNSLLNLSLPGINSGLTAINPSINQLSTLGTNLNSSLSSDSINNGLSSLGQDLSSINSGMNRLGALNSTNINSGLTNLSAGLASVNTNLTNLNAATINQNLASINANLTAASSGASPLNSTLNTSINISNSNINSALNQQGLNRPLNAITNLNSTSSSAQFPFQTIQGVQSIASNLVGSNIVSSSASQNQNSNVNSTVQPVNSSNSSSNVSNTCVSSSSGPIIATSVTTTNATHGSSNNQQINVAQFEIMTSNMSNVLTSQVNANDSSTNPSITAAFRQFTNQNLNQSSINSSNQVQNAIISNMKTVQGIQNQPNTSPSSPFSIPMKSPASNIAPPTPSPSPNRFMLRSPASNSVQSRNSPSPVSTSQSNTSFNVQLQSPMQSPISVGQIHSPVPSPYPPAKSPHLLGVGTPINNKSPAPGGSPGPSVVRPSTPIVQQGMQVLQIIHGTPQGYQTAPQLVTRTHLFGNQQIQIATPAKPNKQPPQILPKPPLQQTTNINQQKQRVTTTVTNQVTQQSQPQIVLAGPQQNPPTATMIPTAQHLLLNQVLPSTGPVIVQQQAGGVQLILRAPTNAQQQTHTAQLTQQQLVRVVTAQGMQLQGITPTFFAVPNGFSSAPPVIRHTPSSPAPSTNPNASGGIVIQNTMVQNSQSQIAQPAPAPATANIQSAQAIIDQSLLPPPKKKAKKKKRAKKKEDEQPKLDLASIMKISGIGDDDDIFDSDLTTEMETTPQPQGEMNTVQNSLATMPSSCVQQNVVQVPTSSTPNVLQVNAPQDNLASGQLVAQFETPVQSTISGQLRLAIDESGRIVLHHTLDPNQPEMDQATAQALIKSLTQGTGQNSQIISQLLQAQTMIQSSQNSNTSRQKSVKSPVPNALNTAQSLSNSSNLQNSTTLANSQLVTSNSMQQNFNNCQPAYVTVQSPSVQSTTNVISQNVGQSAKNITVTRKIIDAKKQSAVDVKSNVCQKINIQNIQSSGANQIRTVNQQQASNVQVVKCNQTKIQNTCINIHQQQNLGKQVEIQIQKSEQNCANVQRTLTSVKCSPNQTQAPSIQESGLFLPQNSIIYHQNASQQIPISQPQNIQNIYEQSLQQSMASTIQRTSTDGIKIETVNIGQQINNPPQQQTANLLHQNADGSLSSIDNNLQFVNDVQLSQQQNVQLNASNAKQQTVKPLNTNAASNQAFEMQNLQTNVFISNSSAPTQQQEQPKTEQHNLCSLSTPAAAVINNGPKITPDILNALSNLNPNDQLLIAYANGQMQVMSQQVLQQFITSQINTQMQAQAQTQAQSQPQAQTQAQSQPQIQTQTQNQTQKIVIGDPDSNNPNLQEVQINTPTSQIIVNSSGGAPTIQNNIQNIVVQAAPSQVPQQIQIQNSGFPSQFIDNLNQQQIRNLGNCTTQNQTSNQNINQQSCAPKKPKIVKKTKVLTVQSTAGKTLNTVSKPVIVTSTVVTTTTTTTTSASPQIKSEPTNKMINFLAQVVDSNKNESPQLVTVNGPLTALSPGQMPTLAPGQVVHRVQTIQLSAQKQQMLSSNQAQIRTLQARKNPSQADQLVIAKLFQEQARILASGKIISNSQHPISSDSETPSITINAPPAVLCSNTITQTTPKNQTPLAGPTQTPTSVCPSSMATPQHIHIATSLPVSTSNIYLSSITNQRVSSPRPPTPLKPQHSQPPPQPQQNQNQVENGQVLVPSNANLINVDSLNSHGLILESQQLIQRHDDAIDVKPNIELAGSAIKQELPTSLQQQQMHNSSPAGQVMSPRVAGKVLQITQSKLPSPDNPSTSPKQGVKRTSDSTPVTRQVNRTDLFEQQLKIDQNGALNPDVNTPFQSKSDACKRLVRYHCLNDHVLSTKDLEKADEIFEETAKHLLSKFNSMMNKYTYLLIMESMRETRTSELMMIDRMIVNEEQATLNKLREQEAKLAVELKTEEKLLVPKVEPNDEETAASTSYSTAAAMSSSSSSMTTPTAPVKLELEMEVGLGKSADYDEWFEIQKELGAYTSTEFKCRTKANRVDRARANGEVRAMGNEASASDLERDLLEDTESLESLALYTQSQCPVQPMERSTNPDEHDDITAQVQSAIDSILSLKKRPTGGPSQQQGGSSSSSSDSNDKLLDQAVRSILGS